MTKDRTGAQRTARHKERRRDAGWCHVRVWVPTQEDANTIKAMATEMRERMTDASGSTASP